MLLANYLIQVARSHPRSERLGGRRRREERRTSPARRFAERLRHTGSSYQFPRHDIQSTAQKEAPLQLPIPLRLKLGDEVRRSDVETHSRSERESVFAERRDILGQEATYHSRDAQGCAGQKRAAPRSARCEKQTRDRQSF